MSSNETIRNSQHARIGSQRTHRLRREYARTGVLYEGAVEVVKPETADRERTTRNYLRNVRRKESKEVRNMIHTAGVRAQRKAIRRRDLSRNKGQLRELELYFDLELGADRVGL